jgi:hypothetical protein
VSLPISIVEELEQQHATAMAIHIGGFLNGIAYRPLAIPVTIMQQHT